MWRMFAVYPDCLSSQSHSVRTIIMVMNDPTSLVMMGSIKQFISLLSCHVEMTPKHPPKRKSHSCMIV